MSIIQSGFSHSYLCTSRPWTTKLQMFPSRFPLWKICKAIPKSSQRRGKEKQRPWQNPGDWILEQRGERIQSMTCSIKQLFYLCICKRRWRPWEHTAWWPGLSRRPTSPGPGPEASMKKWWDYVMTHKQKKSLSHPFNVQPSARRLRYILVSETLVLLKAFDTSKIMSWPQNFCLLFFFWKGLVRVTGWHSAEAVPAQEGSTVGQPCGRHRLCNTDSHPQRTLLRFCRALRLFLCYLKT